MATKHKPVALEMEPFVHSIERRMQDTDCDIERATRELDRLRLYRDVVEALKPEVIRCHGLGP
jgi:hypothetical protein